MPLLIDGHNLIGQMKDISLADPRDEARLLARLQGYAAATRESITVVFDPGDLPGVGRPTAGPSITVIYAPHGEDADSVIIRRIERDRTPRQLTVVSSDRRIVSAAKTCGAQVVSARDFAQQLAERLAPSSKGQAADDKPASSSADVDYWMGIFKEPPPKPPKRPKGSQPKR